MALEKYGIGGVVQENDASEAFADIPQNRVLMMEKLTADAPIKPDIVEGLTTVEQVFEHFKPSVEMEFETEEGATKKETLRFANLGDFGVKGITGQSDYLNELTMKKEQFQKIIKQLKTNKLLKQSVANSDTKQHVINALQALIKELDETK